MAEFIEIAAGEPLHVDFSGLRASVRRRDVGEDGGVSIELYGPGEEPREQLIRFDVFRQDPHYHVPSSDPKQIDMQRGPFEKSLEFAIGCLEKRLPDLLREARYPEIAASVDAAQMPEVAARVRAAAGDAPEPTQVQRIELTPEVRKAMGQ